MAGGGKTTLTTTKTSWRELTPPSAPAPPPQIARSAQARADRSAGFAFSRAKFRSVTRDDGATAPIEAVVHTDANNIIGKPRAPRDDGRRKRAGRNGDEDEIGAVEIEVEIFELLGPCRTPKSSFNTTPGGPAASIL